MASATITRAQLTEAVYQEVGLSRNESAELVETVIEEMCKALVDGDVVKLSHSRLGSDPNGTYLSFLG